MDLRREAPLLRAEPLLREVLFAPARRLLRAAALLLASAFSFAFLFLVRAAFFAAALLAALDLPMFFVKIGMPYRVQVTCFWFVA